MNARKGNWTIPQLLLDLEARVTELESTNKPAYVHRVSFDASNISGIYLDIINDTDTLFTSDSLLEYLMTLPEDTKIMCTGCNSLDIAIISLSKVGNQIIAGLVDTDSVSFTTLRLLTDYVEPIRV